MEPSSMVITFQIARRKVWPSWYDKWWSHRHRFELRSSRCQFRTSHSLGRKHIYNWLECDRYGTLISVRVRIIWLFIRYLGPLWQWKDLGHLTGDRPRGGGNQWRQFVRRMGPSVHFLLSDIFTPFDGPLVIVSLFAAHIRAYITAFTLYTTSDGLGNCNPKQQISKFRS